MTQSKAKIEVDNNQARNLLLSECDNIKHKITSLSDAIDNIVYYNARTKSFRAVCERYQTAREAAYHSIVQLDKLANELFPLFGDIENENDKEQDQ